MNDISAEFNCTATTSTSDVEIERQMYLSGPGVKQKQRVVITLQQRYIDWCQSRIFNIKQRFHYTEITVRWTQRITFAAVQ